jgi:tetratricopeptide (TPR) repeat protein
MRFLFLFLFSFVFHFSFAQESNTIDSLKVLIENASSDSIIVKEQILLAGFYAQKQPILAKEIFVNTVAIVKKEKYQFADKYQKEARIYDDLGVLERRSSNYEESLTYYLKALRVKEQQKDSTNLGRSYHNIAMLFNAQSNYKKAEIYMRKALPLRHKYNDSIQYAKSLNLYGLFKYRLKDIDSALYYYRQAKIFFNRNIRVADVNNNLAVLYAHTNAYKKAQVIYEENLAIFERHDLPERTAITLRSLARISRKLNKLNLSNQYLDRSEKIAIQLGNKKLLYVIYLERYKIANEFGDYKNALKYYQTYRKHRDTVFNIKKVNKIKALELDYLFEKERLADSLKFNAQKQELFSEAKIERAQKQLYVVLFIATILGLIALSFLYTYKRRLNVENRKKEQLEKELLVEKLNSLNQYTDQLLSDNKMRFQFKTELFKKIKHLKSKVNSATTDEYKALILDLRSQINAEKRLDTYFDANTQKDLNFEKQLHETYPSLTKNERDVCTLIRLNLTNKEIMIARDSTVASMKSVRFRIRKKMNAPKGEELEFFIQRLFK